MTKEAERLDPRYGNPERQCRTMTLEERLEHIVAMLTQLVERQQVREWYTTGEFARTVGKAEFTIREYCRLGRINAEKRRSGRGAYPQWVISHDELERYRRHGLLPMIQPDLANARSAAID
jgi:hypothetical protein